MNRLKVRETNPEPIEMFWVTVKRKVYIVAVQFNPTWLKPDRYVVAIIRPSDLRRKDAKGYLHHTWVQALTAREAAKRAAGVEFKLGT